METFTVIIPTLDRCETLAHTLESCIAQEDDHFRILVSDNRSTDATPDVIEEYRRRDSRVESIRPPRRMAMSSHFEFALSHVSEGFLMLLGSDDALLPGCMPRARSILRKHPSAKALHQGTAAVYVYPDVNREGAGVLRLNLQPREETWHAREILESVAQGDEIPWNLPYPYNLAWVRAEILGDLADKTGRRIHSAFPDVFMAIAISTQIDEYIHFCPPFAMLGSSKKSTGAGMCNPNGNRSIESEFLRDLEIPLHPKVNFTRATQIIVGECLLQAQDAELLPSDFPINWEKLVSRAYLETVRNPWGEAEREENLVMLREQSRMLGCAHVIEQAEEFERWQDWRTRLPFSLIPPRPSGFKMDTQSLGLRGVHEAARLAEDVYQAAERGSRPIQFASAEAGELQAWVFQRLAADNEKLAADIAELRCKVQDRRAAHLRTREALAAARKKNKLQQKNEE